MLPGLVIIQPGLGLTGLLLRNLNKVTVVGIHSKY